MLVNRYQGNGYASAMGGFSPTVALSEEDTAQLLPNNHCCRSSGNSRPCELSPGEVSVLLSTTGTAEKRDRKADFVQHKPKPERSNDAKNTPWVATRHSVRAALSPSHLEEDFSDAMSSSQLMANTAIINYTEHQKVSEKLPLCTRVAQHAEPVLLHQSTR